MKSRPRRQRLPLLRMYRLPDSVVFFSVGRWDGKGNLWGYFHNSDEDRLIFKLVHRSELERSELVPAENQPWKYEDFSPHDGHRER